MTANTTTHFSAVYAEWLAARAAVHSENAEGEDVDTRERLVEHAMAAAHPVIPWQFLEKFEVLETALIDREMAGATADDRHLLLLASFKGDLLRRIKAIKESDLDGKLWKELAPFDRDNDSNVEPVS